MQKLQSFIFITSVTLSLGACSALHSLEGERTLPETAGKSDVRHVVTSGERISEIAYMLTGDHGNWVEIARLNQLDDPRRLTTGSTLLIPAHLLKPGTLINAVTATRLSQNPRAQSSTPINQSFDHGEKIVIFQPTAIPGPRQIKAETNRAHINRDFKMTDKRSRGQVANQAGSDQVPDNFSDWVLVIGSYYPKGIYQKPDASSRIMMRVAPGSRLRLGGNVGSWLKVETDKGSGYIRRSDAEILSAKDASTPKEFVARL